MTSQLVIFIAFFFFFHPPTLNLKKNPINQLIKKFWPYRRGGKAFVIGEFIRIYMVESGELSK